MGTHGPYGLTIAERIARLSQREGECLVWMGSRNKKGYGRIGIKGRLQGVHRVAWELLNGPVPDGLEIDHLCGNRACVEITHLRAVTHLENVRSKHVLPITHCKRGHEFTPENTAYQRNGGRRCKTCHRTLALARHHRSKVVPLWRFEQRVCSWCRAHFLPGQPWAVFCSRPCKEAARAERRDRGRTPASAAFRST